jgi:hypothetical protein
MSKTTLNWPGDIGDAPDEGTPAQVEALIDKIARSEEERQQRELFVRKRDTCAGLLWRLTRHAFPPIEEYEGAEGGRQSKPPWYHDNERFCERWVAEWSPCIASLRELGLSPKDLSYLYDPEVHSRRVMEDIRRTTGLVRYEFIRLYREYLDTTVRKGVCENLARLRTALGNKQEWMQGYFEGLSARVRHAKSRESLLAPAPALEQQTVLLESPEKEVSIEDGGLHSSRTRSDRVAPGGPEERSPQAWAEHDDGEVPLRGWNAICKALEVNNGQNTRRQLKRLNAESSGPIAWVSRTPEVNESRLVAWRLDIEERARRAEDNRASRKAAASELAERGGIRQQDYKFHGEKRPNARGKARPAPPGE